MANAALEMLSDLDAALEMVSDLARERDALKRDLSVAVAGLKDQLDGHWATWMAARAEVEGAETSKQLFEREPDVIRARALIAKFEA